jgi:cell shape-determining protein MreC
LSGDWPKFFPSVTILVLLASVATGLAAPITLELTGGSVIKGDLASWNGQQAVVKAEFGSMTFRRDQLSQATIQRLELLSGDPQKLLARISELETTVESLRKDNAALRQQLQGTTATQSVSPAPVISREVMPRANAVTSSVSAPTGLSYTISSTGKRHNSRCRYYGSGRPCGPTDGIACKICGG